MNKLFREENVVKSCFSCEHFRRDEQTGETICIKRKNTPVSEDDVCRKYKYNIFAKQVSRKKELKLDKFDMTDFTLD